MRARRHGYLEDVGDDGVIVLILLLVELLQVGRVIALAVGRHLLPGDSLLPRLSTKKKKKKKKTKKNRSCHNSGGKWLLNTHPVAQTPLEHANIDLKKKFLCVRTFKHMHARILSPFG